MYLLKTISDQFLCYKLFKKILEKVYLMKCLYNYFVANKLFYGSLYAYKKDHSTELIDRIMNQLDKGEAPICLFIDLSKAFDTLNHHILLTKLEHYGIRNTELSWFSSYLSDRSQYVEWSCKFL